MFVTLGGKFLQVAGKFAKSLACCCGDDAGKWYCLTSTDGSYRCAQEYDIEVDQMLSEHETEAECNAQCGVGNVYCYYGEGIGYYCTDYLGGESHLSGPYPSTIECNAACQQVWYCRDKGSGGGETQYECELTDPDQDFLSGPYSSKEACEYRCGNSWWCTYRYINTDEYEYECVQNNTGAPDNAVSGPYPSQVECNEYCKVCEEIRLPEQTPCPECVDDACGYVAGEGGIDGGQWGTCCSNLVETWRYCDGEWTLILPCHPAGERTAGTPACEVYPESLDFPDDPVEGQLYTVECDRVLGFDPSSYKDCSDCQYNCVETDGAYDCELDPAGPHKTLQDCIDKCPEKWGCISTDECVQKPDGTYETETECVDNAPVDCAAGGACCFPDYSCQDGSGFNTEGECVDAGGTFYANGVCPDACPEPPTPGAGCYFPCEEVLSTTGSTPEEAVQNASDLFEGSEGITGTPEDYGLEVRLIDCLDVGGGVQSCSAGVFCCGGLADMDSPQCGSYGYPAPTCGNFASEEEFYSNPYGIPQEWYPGKTCDDPSIDCECDYTYDEVADTREDAEESFLESYGPYNWSLVGGYIYDQDTDQWSYRVVCCEEVSYDDQGNEWCGPITRAGNTETSFAPPP